MNAYRQSEPRREPRDLRLGTRASPPASPSASVASDIAPGDAMPDIANAGCLILWGYNPSMSRLTHATATIEAARRGMKLIVIDPRQVGLANKADVWLRVRPGTDGALALGLANLMIERGWYDRDFIRDWSNGPLLVRSDTGRLLTERDLTPGAASDAISHGTRPRAVRRLRSGCRPLRACRCEPALEGEYQIAAASGPVRATRCSRTTPSCAATIRPRGWKQPAGSRASSWNKRRA